MPDPKPVPNFPEYRWNAAAGRYINSSGRFIKGAELRGALNSFITAQTNQMGIISELLVSGEIKLAEWQAEMMILVKDCNLAGAALERGGWFQMGPSEFGRVGNKIKGEYGFLRNFADEIASGSQKLDGTLGRRAKLYGNQARAAYYDSARASAVGMGFDQERSRLTPSESCDVCVGEEARGWQPIGEIIPIGSRTCLSNCNCYMEFRNSGTKLVRSV